VTLPASGGTDTFEYDLFEASRSGSYLERLFHRRRVAELTRIAELDKQRVLEFGCNTGAILIPLRRSGVDVVGYDISAANVDRLRAHLVAEGLEAKVHSDELPEDARFDVVLLINVLEYATDKGLVLDKIARHLAPNGWLVVCLADPNHPFIRFGKLRAFLSGRSHDDIDEAEPAYPLAEPEFLELITARGGRVVRRAWGMGRLNRWYAVELRNLQPCGEVS